MRTSVFVLAGIQIALLLLAVSSLVFGDADPAGQALGEAWTSLAAMAVAACVVPALVLAVKNRALPLALALALAAPVTLAALLAFAT